MRNLKNLVLFAVVTIGVLLAAIVFRSAPITETAAKAGPLLPQLAQQLKAVHTVKIVHTEDKVTLQRQAQAWTVLEKANYPAADSKVREMLLGLAYLQRLEPKTKNPKYYSILGLTDPEKKTSKAGQFELLDKAGKSIVQVTLGRRKSTGDEPTKRNDLYALVKGDPQSWLVLGRLPAMGAPGAWLQRNLLELERSRITAVTVTHGDGEILRVLPTAAGQMTLMLEGLKADETLQSDYLLADIFSRFTRLQLEDVQPAKQLKWPETADLQVEAQTKDGLLVRISAYTIEDQHWLRLTAVATTPAVPLTKAAKEITPKEQKVAAKPGTKAPPAKSPEQEAKELNARWHGWAYTLADWAYQTLNKRRVDLVKAPEIMPPAATTEDDEDESASAPVAIPNTVVPPTSPDAAAAPEPQPSPSPQADVPETASAPAASTP